MAQIYDGPELNKTEPKKAESLTGLAGKHHRKSRKSQKGFGGGAFGSRLKAALSKSNMKDVGWGLLAPIFWLVPASFFKLSGIAGFSVSFLTTWLAGIYLDKKALQYGAIALGVVHLTYAKAGGVFNSAGYPIWRMGDGTAVAGYIDKPTMGAYISQPTVGAYIDKPTVLSGVDPAPVTFNQLQPAEVAQPIAGFLAEEPRQTKFGANFSRKSDNRRGFSIAAKN